MLLVADGNNLAWAGFHALRRAMGAETPEENIRAALLGLTQSVLGFAIRNGEPPALGRPGQSAQAGFAFDSDHRTSRLVVCFDEGRPLRRRQIYPPYQTGREGNPSFMENEPFVLKGIELFVEAARALPIEIVRGINTEADDLIAAVVAQAPEPRVRIASTDRDFLQLVDGRVSVYSPVKKIVIDESNFTEVTAPRGSDAQPIA
ncbi:MAG: PIN domain-containing protein, partial [Anaerolineaceae bacterium]